MKNSSSIFIVKILIAVIILLVSIGCIYLYVNRDSTGTAVPNQNTNMVGNDKDAHGCIGSAGYSWCEIKNKCLRTWEEKCEATKTVSNTSSKCGLTVTYPLPGSKISFPLTIKGVIDNSKASKLGCSWNQVQSRGGLVQAFYNLNNNGWMAPGIPVSIITGTGATASTTAFTAQLNVYTTNLGLSSGTPLKITFTELNEINDVNPDSFDMYVYLK